MITKFTGNIILRDPKITDAEVHADFSPVPEIVRMYGGDINRLPQPSLSRSREWASWLMERPWAKIIELNGKMVGHMHFSALSHSDRNARLAIGLFEEKNLGRGIGREAIHMALEYAFGEMKLHRVDLRVLSYNERAIRCYKACGFKREGIMRESAFIDGTWHDDWIMSILSHEYKLR